MVAVELGAAEGYERRSHPAIHLKFAVHCIGVKAQGIFAHRVEKQAYQAVLVCTMAQKLGNDFKQLRVGTVIGKTAGVGEYAGQHESRRNRVNIRQ